MTPQKFSPESVLNHVSSIYDKLERISKDISEIKTYTSLEAQRHEMQHREQRRGWIFRMSLSLMAFVLVLTLIFQNQFLPFLNTPPVREAVERAVP